LIHFYKRNMSYRDRPEFKPEEYGLAKEFRLTKFTDLKG